jgi:hypothetical protein
MSNGSVGKLSTSKQTIVENSRRNRSLSPPAKYQVVLSSKITLCVRKDTSRRSLFANDRVSGLRGDVDLLIFRAH